MPVEECTLIKWAIQYYKWGLPLSVRHLRQFAVKILVQKSPQPAGSLPSLGEHWHQRLLSRNPEIKPVLVRGLDRARASAVTKIDVFQEYFELYKSLQEQYQIAP
jgi:Tc5 transposase DNA-binding domain